MKKAILVVSFGTTIQSGRADNILPILELVKKTYSHEYDIFEAFTSRIVIKRLKERGEEAINETDMMKKLIAEGYDDITIQSLHVVGGKEFNKMRKNILHLMLHHKDVKVRFARPLLFFAGQEEFEDDYKILLDALHEEVNTGPDEGVLFVGHGGLSPENAAYAMLQLKALQEGYGYMRFACIESYPELDDLALPWLLGEKPKHIHIYPFLLVVGDHALNDVMGDEEDSVKNQMIAAGYEVSCHPLGLGARQSVQELFLQHLEDALEGKNAYRPLI